MATNQLATKHPIFGWGFDMTKPNTEPLTEPPPPPAAPPASATVASKFLPPAGNQGQTPSCWVWSAAYGVATVEAAMKEGFSPADPANQASTDYAYVKVMADEKKPSGSCSDGEPSNCFRFLKSNGGAPTMQAAPPVLTCAAAWSDYAAATLPSDPRFQVEAWRTMTIKGEQGLANVRNIISQGKPLVYCTSTYTDFIAYRGTPSPYVGDGQIDVNQNGDPIGHCMMIVGYDDTIGAVLLQNSWSPWWGLTVNGAGGYVWMAYTTFQALAQGTASYLTAIADGHESAHGRA